MADENNKEPLLKYCLTPEELQLLAEAVIKGIEKKIPAQEPEFIPFAKAMKFLGIGKTKLLELKTAGELIFYQEAKNYPIMFLTKSLRDWQKRNLK